MLAALAFAAAACVCVAGCSPGADYPSLFPAIHDVPAPREDSKLDADQVQQATEDLITARDHLSAETKPGSPSKPAAAAANPAVKKVRPIPPPPQATGSLPLRPPAADGTQTAGADAKP